MALEDMIESFKSRMMQSTHYLEVDDGTESYLQGGKLRQHEERMLAKLHTMPETSPDMKPLDRAEEE